VTGVVTAASPSSTDGCALAGACANATQTGISSQRMRTSTHEAEYVFRRRQQSFTREPGIRVEDVMFTWQCESRRGKTMWSFADRVVKAVSDVTVGTVIVLVHVALADRTRKTALVPARRARA
jgi:hypothetical protein